MRNNFAFSNCERYIIDKSTENNSIKMKGKSKKKTL